MLLYCPKSRGENIIPKHPILNRKYAGYNDIVLLDSHFLESFHAKQVLDEIRSRSFISNFNQALDVKLILEKFTETIACIKSKCIHIEYMENGKSYC